MQLVLDRFVVTDHGAAVDLSTGRHVELLMSTAGGVAEHARWAARCDRFAQLHHRCLAPLLDFGLLGDIRRFEAWSSEGKWTGPTQQAEHAVQLSCAFLRACGLTDTAASTADVRRLNGRPVLLPGADTGYERAEASEAETVGLPREAYGVVEIPELGVAAIAEMFCADPAFQSMVVRLSGPRPDLEEAVRNLARASRQNGYIPVAVPDVAEAMLPLLDGRSLFVIVRHHSETCWRSVARLVVATQKPHLVLVAGSDGPQRIPAVRLRGADEGRLEAAVLPRPSTPRMQRSVLRAVGRAGGRPSRFRELLWRDGGERSISPAATAPVPPAATAPRVAEGAVPYDVGERSSPLCLPTGPDPTVSPSPESPHSSLPSARACPPGRSRTVLANEIALLERRLSDGVVHAEHGRHAPGERAIRQATAALARRQQWARAADGGLALASLLIKRGRLKEAHRALGQAGQCAQHSEDSRQLVEVAVLSGVLATDEIRLDDAETVLRGALVSAQGLSAVTSEPACLVALSRCLFWRGRFDDSERLLEKLDSYDLQPAVAVAAAIGRSRAAVGRGDVPAAMTHVAAAIQLAGDVKGPSARGGAAYASALAHLAAGDHTRVQADVASCLEASRLGRDPLLGLRARLLAVESARRAEAVACAAAHIRHLRRIASRDLPPILRVRYSLSLDLLGGAPAEVLARRMSSTGLAALRLFVAVPSERSTQHVADELVQILSCCQTSADDGAVLKSLCRHLRARMGAAAVAFYVEERGAQVSLASDGARLDAVVAERLARAGQTIAPHRWQERIVAGAPVRYGGRPIGVLAARWLLSASPDPSSVSIILTTAAAAAAPAVAGAVGGRAQPAASQASLLLGTSRGIEDVRRAVDRAAAAPFPVLIEGESGSGKELVARALGRCGPRRDRPFCAVNCASLPDDLVESELFGHSKGSFTGAFAERPGVFEQAHTGTLFLDEVGELSMRAQAKVLRAIQENEVRRVGENIPRRVDVRLVAATNRCLRDEVVVGRFRVDLLYRLDVIRIVVPPLRERREDIALLVEHFWREATLRLGSKSSLSTATVAALARYDWPGNVRELQNVLAALAVRSPKRGVVPSDALPPNIGGLRTDQACRLDAARRTFEASFVRAALVRSGGHRVRAAAELGVTRQGLTKLMARLGIDDST